MTTLLHLSDTHFGTEVPRAMEAVRRLADEQAPDVVVLSGDVTQRARARQFDSACRFIESLGASHQLVVAGNHDIPLFDLARRVLAPYAGFRRAFGDVLEPRLTLPDMRIAGVHTARAWRHMVGHVSSAQAQSAAEWLAQGDPQALRVVVAHHPALVPDPQDAAQRVRGAEQALRQWLASGVHLVLGGHIHWPAWLSYGSQDRRLWVAQAGTALSCRLRPPFPHSLQVLRQADATQWVLRRWDLELGATRFAARAALPMSTS